MHRYPDNTRGPKGRAFIALDRHFTLPGVCLFAGTVDGPSGWMIEFMVDNDAFPSLWAQALMAYATGKRINVEYDDGFGAGTTCRITGLTVLD